MTKGGGGDAKQRVAVGIGFGDEFGADIAARAGAILDDRPAGPICATATRR